MTDELNGQSSRIPSHVAEQIPRDRRRGIHASETLETLVKDLEQLYALLKKDVDVCIDNIREDDEEAQSWRRMVFRNAFAWIEGVVYAMKQIAAQADDVFPDNVFLPGEISLLNEQAFLIDDLGHTKVSKTYPRTKRNLRFAFRAMAKVFRCDFELDLSTHDGWQSFQKALEIRHRLTHPKSLEILDVSNSELDILFKAISWFGNQFSSLVEASTNSVQNLITESRRMHEANLQSIEEKGIAVWHNLDDLNQVQQLLARLSENKSLDDNLVADVEEAQSRLEQVKSGLLVWLCERIS